jgi:membrane associated rhomboid family serine protease
MDRLLARLERRFSRFAIERLTMALVIAMGLCFLLSLGSPQATERLALDMNAVKRGEVWRLVTHLFIPAGSSLLWQIIAIYFFYFVGTSLESAWGAFKFNIFYLVGAIGTTVAAVITGRGSGAVALNTSVFLAFATVFPELEIYPLFFVPIGIRAKWLGLLAGGYLVYSFVVEGWVGRAAIMAASANYLLFFGEHLVALARRERTMAQQAARRESFRPPPQQTGGRACAMCGAKESEGADIRVCSCDKCGGKPRTLCLEHARNH